MSWQTVLMYAVVAGIGFPAAFRNSTAAALTIAWLAGEIIAIRTGNSLPTSFYFMADIAVIAVIMTKPEACNFLPYRSAWHQLKCLLIERSVPDRIVLLLYGFCWIIYAVPPHPYYTWRLLWAITITQFLAAGVEAFLKFRRARAAVVAQDAPRSGLKYALAWRLAGHG